MPSKKKAGSATANNQRPRPVSQTSAPSTNHTTSSSTNVEALSSTPPVRQEVRISDTAEQVEPPGPSEENDPPTGTVNRKKQKRRQKQAAKLAEQQQQHLNSGLQAMNGQSGNGHIPYPGRGPQKGYFTEEPDYLDGDYVDESGEVEEAFYSGDDQDIGELRHSIQDASKKKKKKKNKKTSQLLDEVRETSMVAASLLGRRALATQQALAHAKVDMRSPQQKKRDQIWNDSKNQERENIKRFWLELGEDERKSLVQVEKEAVLKKMKEQKSPCNCTICGRKRSAIEEELENLYDAYYKELEQYVHPNDAAQARRLMPPPHPRAPSLSQTHSYPSHLPPGHFGDPEDEDDDEEYDDDFDEEEEDELYSDDELEEIPRMPEEFYNFSQSLRVKDGILTVADDLLKNDGKEFINMMDKLADRRMQREQEARFPQTTLSQSHHGHNHAPIEDDDYDDEEDDEDDEDYDSQDLEEEDDDVDALTEEQRMEEGRRMFQVFAARMFEQRVMTAYREKVARERQQKLIEELDEESRLDTQREAKRQREAAKKKEKKRLQKLAKEEEKARKDAEKAAQEAEVRAAEEKRLEEQRHRREEQRKKREAEKKAQEEERAKKEADRQKRLQQERERHQEAERKQREAKDREKKKREEARKKEREEREAKEREVRERKLKEERDRKAQEEESRKQTETVSKLNRNERDRSKENEQQQSRRPPIAIPPGLYPQHSAPVQSPAFTVATPIIPKAPTPARPRQTSQQGQQSLGSSPRSQQAVTETSRNSVSPASGTASQTPVSSTASGKPSNQLPPQHHHHHPQPSAPLHHPQPSAPLSPLSQPGRQNFPFGYGMPMGPGHPPPPGMAPNMMPQMPMYQGPPMGGQYRGFGFPNNAPFPPGINGNRPYPQRQGNMPFTSQPPPMSMPQNTMGKDAPVRGSGHSRQPSASYDRPQDAPSQPQPISRPAPIGRPSSTTPDKKNKRKSADPEVEHLATQLGSKALLDDSDLPLGSSSPNDQSRISNLAPGTGRVPSFSGFNDHLQKHDTFHLGPGTPQANTWAFGTSPGGSSTWGPSPPGMAPNMNSGWPGAAPNGPAPNAFGMGGGLRAHHASRPVTIRMMAAQACRQLSNSTGSPSSGYYPIQAILSQISQMKPVNEAPVLMNEILEILDTEGNHQNGGGSFTVRGDGPAAEVKFDADDTSTTSPANASGIGMGMAPGGPPGGARGSIVGDIGSPIIGGHNSLHHPHSMAPFGGTIGNRF